MPMTQDLMLAILAMDSYNRGYNAGVNLTGSTVGDATVSLESSISLGLENTQSTGFYAASYSWNGKTVISYRGTDSPFGSGAIGGDVANGWILSLAAPASQVTQAAAFYQQVTGKSICAGPAGNVILTGHSPGGGLAEIMSVISGTQGVGFDYAPGAILAEIMGAIGKSVLSPMNWGSFKGISTTGEVLQGGRSGAIQYLVSAVLVALGIPSLGAVLGLEAALASALESNVPQTQLDSNGGFRDPANQLHMQELLVCLQYAQDNGLTDWQPVGKKLWDAFFSDDIAAALGLDRSTGTAEPSGQMGRMIAYSAIDSGTRVFGDTAIRALFDDADQLGAAVSNAGASHELKDLAASIAQIVMQFAGHLAVKKVLAADSPQATSGVLALSADKQTMSIDFSDALWTLGGSLPGKIIGRSSIIANALSKASIDKSDLSAITQFLWGSPNTDMIDRIVLATQNGAVTSTLAPRSGRSQLKIRQRDPRKRHLHPRRRHDIENLRRGVAGQCGGFGLCRRQDDFGGGRRAGQSEGVRQCRRSLSRGQPRRNLAGAARSVQGVTCNWT